MIPKWARRDRARFLREVARLHGGWAVAITRRCHDGLQHHVAVAVTAGKALNAVLTNIDWWIRKDL